MALPRRDSLHHTYADYLTWLDDERDELIDGVAYVKEPPAPSRSHQEIVGELHFQIRLALEGKSCRAYIAPFDVLLPKDGEADLVMLRVSLRRVPIETSVGPTTLPGSWASASPLSAIDREGDRAQYCSKKVRAASMQ